MRLTASRLRRNLYRILDQILETGVPVEIERTGRLLQIVPVAAPGASKLDNLEEHPGFLLCDPEELVHIEWLQEWQP